MPDTAGIECCPLVREPPPNIVRIIILEFALIVPLMEPLVRARRIGEPYGAHIVGSFDSCIVSTVHEP